jgi:hypothetical protein
MDEMLLYNIKIVVHSLAAEKTREALLELVYKKEVVYLLSKLVWLYLDFCYPKLDDGCLWFKRSWIT